MCMSYLGAESGGLPLAQCFPLKSVFLRPAGEESRKKVINLSETACLFILGQPVIFHAWGGGG